jgi:hypothetical protein
VQAGATVAGRFRVDAFAGRGGMATVYRATDLKDGTSAALKQIEVREPRDVERFMREAQLLQKLAHPGLVDGGSDLFALGCVLFECLAGRAAFEVPNLVALLARITLAPVEPLRSLRPEAPAELERSIAALLEKDPAARPRNVVEVLASLRSIAASPLAHDGSLPAAPRGVTPDEERLISVVAATIVAQPAPPAFSQTATWSNPAGVEQHVHALAQQHGARLELFPNALVAVMEAGVGTPGERTLRAARLALALQTELAEGAVVVATGRGVVNRTSPVGQVIDRAVAGAQARPAGPRRSGRALRQSARHALRARGACRQDVAPQRSRAAESRPCGAGQGDILRRSPARGELARADTRGVRRRALGARVARHRRSQAWASRASATSS